MQLTIKNALLVPATTPVIVGAAVKIIFSGGSSLSVADQARASGVSPFIWQDQKRKIRDLVKTMEASA